jgi:MYXO-CTERM domain-containing protein
MEPLVPKLNAIAALLFSLVCASSAAQALVVYDTFALGDGDLDVILGQQINGNDIQIAYPFDMPLASGDRPLETITLRLRNPGGTSGNFTLRLREDVGGVPGPVLEEWSLTTDLVSETDVDFVSVTHPVLVEGAAYWLNLKIDAGTGVGWWMATIPKTMDLLYANTGDLDPSWLVPASDYLIGLATVVVPEPASSWLGVVGVAALVALRRQRARA